MVTNWATLPILSCANVAQLVAIKVAQLVTTKNGHFSIFGFTKCAEIPTL